MADVLVVGAGISGLMAAHRLADKGLRVIVVDENEEVGGRLATRCIRGGRADSGAQFFTVRNRDFRVVVDKWLDEGFVFEWSRGWSDGSLLNAPPDGYPRYAARGGFSNLAHYIAEGLDIRHSTCLASITCDGQGWQSKSANGRGWLSRAVLLTPPVPIALAILHNGAADLPADTVRSLESIRYAPCLCGLFVIEGDIELPEPGALQTPDEPLSWIADNQRKGISPDARVLTVHVNPSESERRWNSSDEDVLAWMLEELRTRLNIRDRVVVEAVLERWRYAVPIVIHPGRTLFVDHPRPLAFAGDAFAGPRFEGAVLSGWAAADALVTYLSTI